MNLSAVICTHNRAELLKKCIQSIENQMTEGIEVIIVDNNSTDDTKNTVSYFQTTISSLLYVFERNTGLSHARNRGLAESTSDWVLFLDDDALCEENTLTVALELIRVQSDVGIIGGVYKPYFDAPKPKWLPENFGSNIPAYKEFRLISDIDEQLPTGGIIMFKKAVFSTTGTFDPDFGMKGNKTGYGEETDLVIKAIENKIKVGISPDLRIRHLVAQNKYYIIWHIRSYYLSRKAYFKIRQPSLYSVMRYFIRGNAATIFKRLPKWIMDKNYYWQNFLIEATYPFSYLLAYLMKHQK
jgi:glycosyltransferase involved in cell wall biosynthesis